MASKAQVLNDSGNKIAVFTDVGGAATTYNHKPARDRHP